MSFTWQCHKHSQTLQTSLSERAQLNLRKSYLNKTHAIDHKVWCANSNQQHVSALMEDLNENTICLTLLSHINITFHAGNIFHQACAALLASLMYDHRDMQFIYHAIPLIVIILEYIYIYVVRQQGQQFFFLFANYRFIV